MNRQVFSIGQLASASGCKVPTIRYYENIGLLPEPPRTEGGQRRYGQSHLQTLKFICHGRELGFAINAIRELLCLNDEQTESQHRADQIAAAHLAVIEGKITRLSLLRDELKAMISACESGADRGCCQVLSVLADHQLCHHDHGVKEFEH